MNKKGDYAKTIIYFSLAIVFFIIITIGLLRILGDDRKTKECKPESCFVRSDGCPTGKFHISVYKCENEETNMCCLSPDEQAKYNKGTQSGTETPSTTSGSQSGNVYIKLGESTVPLSGSMTMKAGTEYTLKISADGKITYCSIKVLEKETMTELKDTSWTSSLAGTDCKTGVAITFNPKVAQINKEYTLQIEGKNESTNPINIKTTYLNIKVTAPPLP